MREPSVEKEGETHLAEMETSLLPGERKDHELEQVTMVIVKVAVDEVEPHHVQIPYNQVWLPRQCTCY